MLLANALTHYYDDVRKALRGLLVDPPVSRGFSPGPELPELTPAMREYLSVSDLAHSPMGEYEGRRLSLLDLTRNPATNTTKTFASLVIVARAVRHIQESGEPVTIITPSSANKAIAMRDATLRAISAGLVGADQLNTVSVVPSGSIGKLRSSALSTDPYLRARNPIAVFNGADTSQVKSIALDLVEHHGAHITQSTKSNLWYTLQLENYLAADIVRALAEAEFFPAGPGPRLHVHAVSSAYGLLGHAHGRELLGATDTPPPHYLLVQHLGAPDMVLSLHNGGTVDPADVPAYAFQEDTGLWAQEGDPHFPAVTFTPDEALDPTFYTRNPPTSVRMNELIHGQGGNGIVVSLAECLQRYGQVRLLLGRAGLQLPADPTRIREWSLVMAVVGLLNAVDRGLVPERDILIHGSGSYYAPQVGTLVAQDLQPVTDSSALLRVVLDACVR